MDKATPQSVTMFFDTHCHIDFDEFDCDRERVLHESKRHGIHNILVPGVSLSQSRQLLTLKTDSQIRLLKAFGLHPFFMSSHQQGDFDAIAMLALKHKQDIVAIGECGIDRSLGDLISQQRLFQQHIELANELGLPLVVHHRQSHDLIAQSFKTVTPLFGGVIHAFSGSRQTAEYYVERGFQLGVGGIITYPRAKKTRDVVEALEIEHLVLETDAPAMPLYGFQGLRNEPLKVIKVFDSLCKLKGIQNDDEQQALASALYSSSCSLFRI